MSVSPISFQANQETKKPKQKQKKNIKGAILAMTVGSVAPLAVLPANLLLAKGLTKPSSTLSKEQIKTVNKGAQKVLTKMTDLAKKGVKISDVPLDEYMEIPNMPKWISDMMPFNSAAMGKNAFFSDVANEIFISKEKLPLAAFHEMGHAYNFNSSAFWKAMQKSRMPLMAISSIFIAIPALTKNHKAKEGEELTAKQKFTNGLRKASPFLAAACYLPTVLEEGMATLRGNKWAKEIFGKGAELAKKVAKTNRFGFASYSLVALAAGLSALAAKKVKDNSDEKLAQKTQQN